MASVTAAHFVSGSSLLSGHVGSSAEARSNLEQISLRIPGMTHCGLRSVNKLDTLHARALAKATSRKVLKKAERTESNGLAGKIVCRKGMALVFVGTEVAPWSKTGGLGDVLGGLPPALAVSSREIRLYSYRDG